MKDGDAVAVAPPANLSDGGAVAIENNRRPVMPSTCDFIAHLYSKPGGDPEGKEVEHQKYLEKNFTISI
jgi:hypothetical protein